MLKELARWFNRFSDSQRFEVVEWEEQLCRKFQHKPCEEGDVLLINKLIEEKDHEEPQHLLPL